MDNSKFTCYVVQITQSECRVRIAYVLDADTYMALTKTYRMHEIMSNFTNQKLAYGVVRAFRKSYKSRHGHIRFQKS